MNGSQRPDLSVWRGMTLPSLTKIPIWTVLAFLACAFVAFSPSLVHVYGLHNDYEMLYYRGASFLHPEAEHLFAIVRPVAALLTNITMLPTHELGDYRATRIFSILTLSLLGAQMIGICVHRLRVRVLDGVAIALATFLGLPFIYSVVNATAWAGHLLPIFLAFWAYDILSRTNMQLVPFTGLVASRDWQGAFERALFYVRLRSVWLGSLLLQVGLYDHPPNTLIVALFPVIVALFSHTRQSYRISIVARDLAFMGANLVFYFLSAKLLYLPFVRLFTPLVDRVPDPNGNPLVARLTATYRFELNLDPMAALARLGNLLRVCGDVWFLPQLNVHVFFGAGVVLALIGANVIGLLRRRRGVGLREDDDVSRLVFSSWTSGGVFSAAVVTICFVVSGIAILASATGFVTYRTIAVPTALTAIVFIFVVRVVASVIYRSVGNPLDGAGWAANAAMIVALGAALASNFYVDKISMVLARNELSYFEGIVREAIREKTNTIVIVDPRPFELPEDIPVVADRHGRALPPYELGCFSGYCLQTGAIVHIAAQQLGYRGRPFNVYSNRGEDPVPGLTCEMLTGPAMTVPPNASQKSVDVIKWYRSFRPLTCVTYSLDWHDLGYSP